MRKSGEAATSEMATAKSLRFGLQLSALFGGKVKMTEVTLIDPVIAVPQTQTAGKSAEDAAPPQADRDRQRPRSSPSASTGFSSRTAR